MKKNRKVSVFEIVWYSIMGAAAIWGLVFIILGIAARNAGLKDAIYLANKSYPGGFLKTGIIVLVLASLLAIIVLLVNAKTADREVEKQQRRAARLAAASEVKSEPVQE